MPFKVLKVYFVIIFAAFTEPELEKKPTTETLRPPVGALMKVLALRYYRFRAALWIRFLV
jgi:hypothetical protein